MKPFMKKRITDLISIRTYCDRNMDPNSPRNRNTSKRSYVGISFTDVISKHNSIGMVAVASSIIGILQKFRLFGVFGNYEKKMS